MRETATNQQTGAKLYRDDQGAWQPLESATNPQTGQTAYKIDGKWEVQDRRDTPPTETIAGRPNRPLDASYFINKEVIPGMGMPEKLANLFSMGAQNTGAGIGQLGRMGANKLGLYPDDKLQAYQEQVQNLDRVAEPLRQSTDWKGTLAEILGGAMPILPVGAEGLAESLLPRVGQAANIGMKTAVTQPVLGKEPWKEKGEQLAMGAVLGPVTTEATMLLSKPMIWGLDKAVNWFKQAMPGKTITTASGEASTEFRLILEENGIDWDKLSKGAKEYLHQQGRGGVAIPGNLTPEQRVAQAEYNALDMPVTKGQLLRDHNQMNLENSVSGTPYGSELSHVYDQQNKSMIDNILKLQKQTGVEGPLKGDVGEIVGDTVKGHINKVQAEKIGPAYDAITAEYGASTIHPKQLLDSVEDLIKRDARVGNLKWLRGHIREDKIANLSPEQIKAMKASPEMEQSILDEAYLTTEQTENVRKMITGWVNDVKTSDTEKQFYNKFINDIGEDVKRGVGSDVYAPARELAKTEKLDLLDSKTVDRAFRDTNGSEQWFDKSIVNSNITDKEIKTFWDLLGKAGDKGHATKKQVQSLTLQWVMDQATKGTGLTRLQDAKFSVPAFKKALDKLGYSQIGSGKTRLEVIFSSDSEALKMLSSMRRIGERNIPVRMAAGSDTASRTMNILDTLSNIPKAGTAANWAKKYLIHGSNKVQANVAASSHPDMAMNTINKEANALRKQGLNRQMNRHTPMASALTGERERKKLSNLLAGEPVNARVDSNTRRSLANQLMQGR